MLKKQVSANDRIDFSYWALYDTCKSYCKTQEEFNEKMFKIRQGYLNVTCGEIKHEKPRNTSESKTC